MDRINTQVIYRFSVPDYFANDVTVTLGWQDSSNRGSYINAHVLLNLLNELGKAIKCKAWLAEHFIAFSQQV